MNITRSKINSFICGYQSCQSVPKIGNLEFEHSKRDVADASILIAERLNNLRHDRIRLRQLVRLLLGSRDLSTSYPLTQRNATIRDFLNTMGDCENGLLIPSFKICPWDPPTAPTQLDGDRELVAVTLCCINEPPRIIIRARLGLEQTLITAALCAVDGVMDLWHSYGCPKTVDNSALWVARCIFGNSDTQALPKFFDLSASKQVEVAVDGRDYKCYPRTAVEIRLLTYFLA